MKKQFLFTLLTLGFVACTQAKRLQNSGVTEFQNTNLYGSDFGLREKELVLTFDDGPGDNTLKLATFLRDQGVPAVFFMTTDAAKSRESIVRAVSEMKFADGRFAHTVANHTMTHPLLKSGNTLDEIRGANAFLEKYVTGKFFFRPPYGYFEQNKPSDRFMRENPTDVNPLVNSLNATDLRKYVGPVYWDIGGHLQGDYAADWACWSLPEVQKILPSRASSLLPAECGQRYEREVEDLGKGIILSHDIHAKTVEMMMGSEALYGKPGTPSLIKNLKSKGFRFVKLDSHEDAVSQWTRARAASSFTGDIAFSYASSKTASGYDVAFKATCTNADRIEMRLNEVKGDGSTNIDGVVHVATVSEENNYTTKYMRHFGAAGTRFVTFSAYSQGQLFARQTFLFNIK